MYVLQNATAFNNACSASTRTWHTYVGYEEESLPPDYQRVEYLYSGNGGYVNTGFVPDENTTYEVKFRFDALPTNLGHNFAVFGTTGANLYASPSDGTVGLLGGRMTGKYYYGISVSKNTDYILRSTPLRIYLNGTSHNANQASLVTPADSIYLFDINNNGSPSGQHMMGRIYYFKAVDNTTGFTKCYMIPCKKMYSGGAYSLGFYDIITHTFHSPSASTSRGADVTDDHLTGDGVNGEIISMKWNNVVCGADGLSVGTTCMDSLQMEVRKSAVSTFMGKTLFPYVGLEVSSSVTTYVPLGKFYVTDEETSDDGNTLIVTAYDGMINLNSQLKVSELDLINGRSAWNILVAICRKFDFDISEFDTETNLYSSDGYRLYSDDDYALLASNEAKGIYFNDIKDGTYREYIGWVAGICGCNAHFDRLGNLKLTPYTDYSFNIGRNVQYQQQTKIKYGGTVNYTSLISGTSAIPVYPNDYTGNAIYFTNPYMTSEQLTRVCQLVIGDVGDTISVTPVECVWRCNPCVDVGDIVYVEDANGNNLPVYVMEREIEISGGVKETLYCYADTEEGQFLNNPTNTGFKNAEFSILSDGTPQLVFGSHTFTAQTITINGTNYYILAET